MSYGWYITDKGWNLGLKLAAGTVPNGLQITRCMVGSGDIGSGDPMLRNNLLEPIASATSTTPKVEDNVVSLVIEYRNNMNGGLQQGFNIRELGIFAMDPDEGEILLYYGTLGEHPQWVDAYTDIIETRRYPVAMSFQRAERAEILYTSLVYMTEQDVYTYCMTTVLPVFMEDVADAIAAHNASATAHPAIRSLIESLRNELETFEQSLINNISGQSVSEDFAALTGLTVSGTWNEAQQRMEF